MKASSLLRHIWVGCFICGLFLFTTGVAYATGGPGGDAVKEEAPAKKELVVKQEDPAKRKAEVATAVTPKDPAAAKPESKNPEVKKQEASAGFVSFNFLYYLFYKTNFAEATNNALRSSWNAFIGKLIG